MVECTRFYLQYGGALHFLRSSRQPHYSSIPARTRLRPSKQCHIWPLRTAALVSSSRTLHLLIATNQTPSMTAGEFSRAKDYPCPDLYRNSFPWPDSLNKCTLQPFKILDPILRAIVQCNSANSSVATQVENLLKDLMAIPLGTAKETINVYYGFVIDSGGNRIQERHYQVCRLYPASYDLQLEWDRGVQNFKGHMVFWKKCTSLTTNQTQYPIWPSMHTRHSSGLL
jgi:hypothetical protein